MFLASFLLLPSSLSLAQLTKIFSGGAFLFLLPIIFTRYYKKFFMRKMPLWCWQNWLRYRPSVASLLNRLSALWMFFFLNREKHWFIKKVHRNKKSPSKMISPQFFFVKYKRSSYKVPGFDTIFFLHDLETGQKNCT